MVESGIAQPSLPWFVRGVVRFLRDRFLRNFGRALGPQAPLLAHQPHRSPVVLQAFPGTQLVHSAAFAVRSVATLAHSLASRFRRRLSSAFPLVVMFLIDEGSRQQSLKGFLVESQIAPARGHGIGGERNVQLTLL